MDPELRTNMRRNWIQCLYEFASPELQRFWVTAQPEIVVSFTECMCGWFDDLRLGDGLETAMQEGWLSSDEAENIAEFHRLADSYEHPPVFDDADILRDPRWRDIVRAAQEAWRGLREIITDTAEREEMESLEKRWGKVAERHS